MDIRTQALTYITQHATVATHVLEDLIDAPKGEVSRQLHVMEGEGLIRWVTIDSRIRGWELVKAAPPIQRTLHRRQIVSLFNPVQLV